MVQISPPQATCNRQPEVNIFYMEHNTGDMNIFMNRYNYVKTKQKPSKQDNLTLLKRDVINFSNERTRLYRKPIHTDFLEPPKPLMYQSDV